MIWRHKKTGAVLDLVKTWEGGQLHTEGGRPLSYDRGDFLGYDTGMNPPYLRVFPAQLILTEYEPATEPPRGEPRVRGPHQIQVVVTIDYAAQGRKDATNFLRAIREAEREFETRGDGKGAM